MMRLSLLSLLLFPGREEANAGGPGSNACICVTLNILGGDNEITCEAGRQFAFHNKPACLLINGRFV